MKELDKYKAKEIQRLSLQMENLRLLRELKKIHTK
jgi:hypothetical protein